MRWFQFFIFERHVLVDKFIGLFIFGFFIHLSNSGYVPFEDCGSAYHLESIDVGGCTSYPCRIAIGSTVTVTAHLMIQGTNFNSADLVQKVYFVVSKILLEAQVFPDPCASVRSGSKFTSCNVEIGQRVIYESNVTVRNVPPLPATLFWTISNEATNELVVCYRTTVVVAN